MDKKYQSRHEAIKDHKDNYRSQGWPKGKFAPDGPDSIRISRITNQISSGDTILDIGCNDGSFGYIIQHKGCIVYGVDVVAELVELATQRGVIASVCPAEEIKFKNDFFDLVNMAETLEHCFEPTEALDQVVRVLSPEGIFTGSVPHPKGLLSGSKNIGDYHQQTFQVDQLEKLLQSYFEDVDIIATPYNAEWAKNNNIDPEQPQWSNWVCKKKK